VVYGVFPVIGTLGVIFLALKKGLFNPLIR
jgi:predicted nucleic acid-binding protein